VSRYAKIFFLFVVIAPLFFAARAAAQFPPAPGTGPGLAETIEAIDSARVTTRILYITAHPDDESSALLTYLARGLHADVALLSLTHGEGGQNALGPEQAPQLGLIRTQELLAATRGYGVKLYFTRAKDFGFSKTPEETEKIWGDQVLEDMVRVIRTFRPSIVINNFGGVHSGHGHHQAAGLLTPRAVALAADASYVTASSREFGQPAAWTNLPNGVRILDVDRFSETPRGTVLPVDEVSPLWGKSWREIGIDAFANHRTQGITAFLGSSFLRRPVALVPKDGKPFDAHELAEPIQTLAVDNAILSCAPPGYILSMTKSADANLVKARQAALALDWPEAVAATADAAKRVDGPLARNSEPANCTSAALGKLHRLQEKIDYALQLIAGLQVMATTEQNQVAAGEEFKVSVAHHCRQQINCQFESVGLSADGMQQIKNEKGSAGNELFVIQTGPSSLKESAFQFGQPERDVLVSMIQTVSIDGHRFTVRAPVTHVAASSTRVDRVPLRVVPAYTLAVEPKQTIDVLAKQHKPFDVLLRVHSYTTKPEKISVGLDAPPGWTTTAPVEVNFAGEGDRYAKFTLTPPVKLAAGNYTIAAYAKRGDEKFSTSLEPLPSLPTQLWEEPAQTVVHAFDINVPENLRVGYITAESEPVPEALRNLGIKVELLDAAALNFGDLSKFDSIIVGIRGYELRSDLTGANQRLLDYVRNGGTLLLQYQRDFAWDKFQYAPYPAKIDSGKPGAPLPRITDENSPVKFLKPDDPLLNAPNKIRPDDFNGWVQERGLYFWTDFDSRYVPLLAMNDPGEPDLNGGLVYTHLGKGVYIYTGLAFFRQLPEGVPGAYRMMVNLLSATHGK
jgi:LmbE family N-acetylglucosaminyl deacetylase